MTKTPQFSLSLALASTLLASGICHADTPPVSAPSATPAPIVRSHGHTVVTPVPPPDQNTQTAPAKPTTNK